MRKFMSALVAAFFVAGILGTFSVASAAAPVEKPCWSHLDDDPLSETFGDQVPVWAMGGGHLQHQEAGVDTLLGSFATRAECEAAFAEVSSPE
jgi:hypothetical protein